jgi:hypothetical protein
MQRKERIMHARALLWAGSVGLVLTQGCSSSSSTQPSIAETKAWLGPAFKGSGTSGSGQSIAAGLDTVTCGDHASPAGSFGPARGSHSHIGCLFDKNDHPSATMEWIVETASDGDLVHVRLTMNPDFVDNTYGQDAIGWADRAGPMKPGMMRGPGGMMMPPPEMSGHTFMDLVGSDHAEFKLRDADNKLVMHFNADYLSADRSADSGYASLGVSGGDGKMMLGDPADVVAISTSLERDLNACGMPSYTVDSPATDADYTPNAKAPDWDYRVVYDVWVRAAAFGDAGFGSALVDYVHASPSKADGPSVDVTPRDCPPDWPPYCTEPGGCKHACGEQPDETCTPSTPPPPAAGHGAPEPEEGPL